MTHYRVECEYGVTHAQCRCPSPTKAVSHVKCDTPADHDPEALALAEPPVINAAEHCRIRFRLVAEYDAAVSQGRDVQGMLGLMVDEIRWLVDQESENGHAKPHECATATLEQTDGSVGPTLGLVAQWGSSTAQSVPPVPQYLLAINADGHIGRAIMPHDGPVDFDTIRIWEARISVDMGHRSAAVLGWQRLDPPDVSQ